jgi:hypothetical protein
MDEVCPVRWYLFSWNDVLRLPLPPEVRREEVEVLLDRQAETLAYWGEREPQMLGDLPWSWVREDLAIAPWHLGEWFGIFRDLRFFFYLHLSESGQLLSVHVLGAREDGGDYLAAGLDELVRRREEVLSFLADEKMNL